MLSLFTIYRRKLRAAGLQRGQVTLTFDDGPGPATPALLDVLDEHRVSACFCVVGTEVLKRPQLVCRMAASGHLVVNHTHHHIHPFQLDAGLLHREIDACDVAIGQALNVADYTSDFFRIPWGLLTPSVRRTVRARGLQQLVVTHYDRDARFGDADRARITDSMLKSVRRRGGGMLVLHDGCLTRPEDADYDAWAQSPLNRNWVPRSVDQLIRSLKADGFRFVIPQCEHNQDRLVA